MNKITWRSALGEILIVIIGITIAISMNKCAEDNRNNVLKTQYLESLQSDIESDRLQLQENVTRLKTKLKAIDSIVRYLNIEPEGRSIIGRRLFEVSTLVEFIPKDVTYSTLINSGDMKLLNDLSLKTSIEEHYSKNYKKLSRDYKRMENIHQKYLADYYIDYINYDDTIEGGLDFQNKKRLGNILYSMQGAIYIKIVVTDESIESCDATLNEITKVLEENSTMSLY